MTDAIRPADATDTDACVDILNEWIDATQWMTRIHRADGVRNHYRSFVFPERDLFVAGTPPAGFMAVDSDANLVSALYTAMPGRGLGKRFLDLVKTGRRVLRLWTFQAKTGVWAFNKREGFTEERRIDGDNEESLPDILFRWEAA